jgi:hypothetical protein
MHASREIIRRRSGANRTARTRVSRSSSPVWGLSRPPAPFDSGTGRVIVPRSSDSLATSTARRSATGTAVSSLGHRSRRDHDVAALRGVSWDGGWNGLGPGLGVFRDVRRAGVPSLRRHFANKARNDILESLEDLGPDTQYDNSGQLVNPTAEGIPPQNVCKPLVGWEFTLGTGYQSRAVSGPWGSLSKVTNPSSSRPRAVPPVAGR